MNSKQLIFSSCSVNSLTDILILQYELKAVDISNLQCELKTMDISILQCEPKAMDISIPKCQLKLNVSTFKAWLFYHDDLYMCHYFYPSFFMSHAICSLVQVPQPSACDILSAIMWFPVTLISNFVTCYESVL